MLIMSAVHYAFLWDVLILLMARHSHHETVLI